ncbi:MAG: YihY/virulence factor BrkB family protein [Treponema sp.]|nr:YihY/virulence factor BrkB family protein [Treponema sp.]
MKIKIASIIKNKITSSQRLRKMGQIFYLTCSNFNGNNLWDSASACSFGFIFSFVPLALIIFTVLVGILRVNPALIDYVNAFSDEIETIVDIKPFIDNILNKKNFHVVDIFLAVWIIWMARKMFISIIRAMTKIFNFQRKHRGILNQALMFISEFLFVIVITAIIIFIFSFNQLVSANVFEPLRKLLPEIVNQSSNNIFSFAMYFVIFIFTFFAYRVLSGTKPPVLICFLCGLLDSICFFFISTWVSKFMNLTNYNIVYGTISTIIVLMMIIYSFFLFFLFFAQMIYVIQNFQLLTECEVYLLPPSEKKGWFVSLRRVLFINPTSLKTAENARSYKEGDVVFEAGQKVDSVYYIRSGIIREQIGDEIIEHVKGSFIGDTLCLLDEEFRGTGVAATDCKVLIFTEQEFKSFMKKSPLAASKALTKLAEI